MITQYLNLVSEFQKTFKHPMPEMPDLSDEATNKLRPALIAEELHELRKAIEENDRLETLDALADLQYVHSGAVLAWGMRAQFDAPTITLRLAKIHDMNAHLAEMFGVNAIMEVIAKTGNWSSVVMQLRTLQSHLSQLVWSLGFAPVFDSAFAEVHRSNLSKLWSDKDLETTDERFQSERWSAESADGGFIMRRWDGKIIKSPSYSPAQLSKFI